MRSLLKLLFGERSNNVLIIKKDGQDWASVKDLGELVGFINEYSAVKDLYSVPKVLNLTGADKRKFFAPGVHRNCPVWFVSESGIWKIVGRSIAPWAENFRATFFIKNASRIYNQKLVVKIPLNGMLRRTHHD